MKTQLTLLALGLTITSTWGQGTVDFRNGGIIFPTPADRLVYADHVGGTPLVGTNYGAALWFVPGYDLAGVDARISPDRGRRTGPQFRFRVRSTATPGTWAVPAGVNSLLILDGVGLEQVATLQVRVWDWVKYPTFQAAFVAGEYAVSEPFSYTVPGAGAAPQAYYMDNLRAFPNPSGISLSVNDVVVAEGSNGVFQADFKVSLFTEQADPVSVDYTTEDGTALAGEDYVATSGTLTFASGETTKTVSITLTADGPAEPDERFSLRLSNPVNGVLGKARGTCTITEVRIAGISVDTAVSFNTVIGRRYAVERSSNTIDWEPVIEAADVPGTGEIVTIIDRGSGCQGVRTYRARLIE